MNEQDRQLFEALTRRHAQLENSVALLKSDLDTLKSQLATPEAPRHTPPPVPVLPPMPPIPEPVAAATPPPLPETTFSALTEAKSEPPPVAPTEPTPPIANKEPRQSLEVQFVRWWLPRIGVVFLLLTLVTFSVLVHKALYQYMGPWSKLSVLALISGGLIAGGFRLERKSVGMLLYGRILAAGGLACLYYTLYGATYVEQIRVIPSRLLGSILLLAWSGWVIWLAEKRKSELLSVFAIALAYFSSAITPVGDFTMVANLILAATAVTFLIRNAWTGLSYLCLIGTYGGFFRQLVAEHGFHPYDYHMLPVVSFTPLAVYLIGAWVIFTAGIFLARTPAFEAGKRMAFLCLNNGAFAGLLLVADQQAHFGHVGGILGATGAAFLAAWGLALWIRSADTDIAGAYLTQGLAIGTGGIAIAYTGVTRGLVITIESVFLAASGAYSRNRILKFGAGLTAILGSFYLAAEIVRGTNYPWIFTIGGELAMLVNAWMARREFWSESRETARFVWTSAYYILLGLGLLAFGTCWHESAEWLPVDLSAFALVLTFVVYVVPLFELAPLSQLLLVLAQVIAFLPQPNPYQTFPATDWTRNWVAIATMILVTWWPRQKLVRTSGWLQPFLAIYALAMVAFCYNAIQPHVMEQTWMMAASLLSLVFLAYGLRSRVWSFAIAGQIFLALSVWTFLDFDVTGAPHFPWTWWAAAIPPLVVFLTGWVAREWLPRHESVDASAGGALRFCGRVYQSIATGLAIRWIFGTVPDADQTLALFGMGTALLLLNVRWPSAYGLRIAFVFDLIGVLTYLSGAGIFENDHLFTTPDVIGFLLFLAQPAILKRWSATLVYSAEAWTLIIVSTVSTWIFVSNGIAATDAKEMTMAWALFAVVLAGIGFIAGERRQRWCGLAILAAAMVRVGVYDFWQFSGLDKVLTFFALTVICLGLSFLYYKFADKLKEWL